MGTRSALVLALVASCTHTAPGERPEVAIFVDEGARAGLRAVVDSESFLSEESERPSFGYTRAAVWARARFAPQGDGPWLLEVAHPQLDHLAVHVRTRSGGFRSFTTGDATPFATRPTRHRTFVFPMPEDAARPFEVYVRTTSSGSIVLPLRFFRPGEFAEHAAAAELGFGLYYAFLLAMAIYNLFLFVASREKGYLFYVSYLASFALFQAALEGHAYRWLWPEAPWLASSMTGVALALALASGCLFVRKMLELAARGDGRALRYAAIVLAASVPLFFLAYPVAIRGLTLGAVVVIVGIVVVMVRALARGERAARYLVAAFAAVVPGGLALAARQLELAPSSFWTEHLVKIGTAAEAIILSFALADRLDRLTRREAEAQAKLLVLERGFAMRELARLDEERRRLALELHDGLGQTLLALASDLRHGAQDALADRAAEAVRDARAMAHRLHPARLERLGLSEAIRTSAEEIFESAELEHEVVVQDVDACLARERWLHVYRIAQEAVSNIVKHAGAGEATLSLRRDGEHVVLRVSDDGRADSSALEEGLGIQGMRERAKQLGATLRIAAGLDGRGLGLALEVPVDGARADRG